MDILKRSPYVIRGFKWTHRLPGEIYLACIFLLAFLIIYSATRIDFPLLGDEKRFHLPTIVQFSSTLTSPELLLEALRSYRAANGPLPYIIFALWGRIAGYTPQHLRIISAVFSFGTILLYYRLNRLIAHQNPLSASLLLFFWPYYFTHSFTLLNHSIALFFGIGGIFWFISFEKSGRITYLVLASLFLSLTVFTRQTYIILPLGVGIWAFIQYIRKRQIQVLWGLIPSVVSVIGFGFLIIIWHGLVPPGFQNAHRIELDTERLLFAFLSTGVFFFPLIFNALKQKYIFISGMLISGLLYCLNLYNTHAFIPITTAKGIVPVALSLFQGYSPLGTLILELTLITTGASILLFIFSGIQRVYDHFIALLCLLSVPASLFTSYLFELYLIQAIPWLILLTSHQVTSHRWRTVWISTYIISAAIYFYLKAYLGIS